MNIVLFTDRFPAVAGNTKRKCRYWYDLKYSAWTIRITQGDTGNSGRRQRCESS